MTIGEYLCKREMAQFEDAQKMAQIYRQKFGELPPKEVFSEYFMLFCNADEAMEIPAFRAQMETGDCFEKCESFMREHKPMFESYEDFLEACFAEN